MKQLYITLVAAVFCITATAQTRKADRLFNNWNYYRAAQLYEKEAAKNPSADVYFKLGECYRKMNCCKQQEQAAYDQVNAAGTYRIPEFYLSYGHVLNTNGNYSQAKAAYDKYSTLVPGDNRGAFFGNAIGIAAKDHESDEHINVSSLAAVNSKNADLAPVFYKDGMVFASSRKTPGHGKIYGWTGANYLDLYAAKKGKTDQEFTDVSPFGGKKINKKYHDGPACFSKNFDTIYISRVEKYLKGDDIKALQIERNKIFISTMKDDKWTKAVPFSLNSDLYSVANPFLTADGSRIYFVSDMPGGYGETDIYYATREGAGWSAPVNMGPNINTFNREKYPSLNPDGTFYFSSDGYQGFGGMDICVAVSDRGVFQKAKPLKSPFNSSRDESGIIFLNDGKTGYITSNRASSQGDDDLFYFGPIRDKTGAEVAVSDYTIGYEPKKEEEKVAEATPVVTEPAVEQQVDPVVSTRETVNASQPREGSIYFDFDKADLRPDAISYLDSVVTYMEIFPEKTLLVGGHCDQHGTSEYNLRLSKLRNASAVRYLSAKGVQKTRIVATGYGLDKMVNHCVKGVECSEAENQLNRRVAFEFK